MKFKYLAIGIMSASLLYSCGGGATETSETASEEVTTEEVAEEATEEEAPTEMTSIVEWSGGVVGGGYGHTGTLEFSEESLEIEDGKITGGSFTVDMTSMKTTDDAYSEEKTPEMLIGHLSTGDFFLVDEFPTAEFVITSTGENTVTGDLTIRGITKEVTVENVMVEEADGKTVATGELVFNRQDFDVAYTSSMKDIVISDDISLKITVVK